MIPTLNPEIRTRPRLSGEASVSHFREWCLDVLMFNKPYPNQLINQSINHSINQSINQGSRQSINQFVRVKTWDNRGCPLYLSINKPTRCLPGGGGGLSIVTRHERHSVRIALLTIRGKSVEGTRCISFGRNQVFLRCILLVFSHFSN